MKGNIVSIGFKNCPKCGKPYRGHPAMSRENSIPICPDCGTREALESMGVSRAEQEQILDTIHNCNME